MLEHRAGSNLYRLSRSLMAKQIITAERLRELLHYNPDTGIFTWKANRQGGGATPGKKAGYVTTTGYVQIGVDRVGYLAHRLAWLYMTGAFPALHIDHINGSRTDNRWLNIRNVNFVTNAQNIRKAMNSNKSSGMLGVSLYKRTGRWQAQISVGGTPKPLGYFNTPEEAYSAYLAAKRVHHLGCTI